MKLARAFIVAFAGGFLTTVLPIADNIASGKNVAFSVLASLAIGAVAGGIAAGVRAIIAVLPLFVDDNNFGLKRQPRTRG